MKLFCYKWSSSASDPGLLQNYDSTTQGKHWKLFWKIIIVLILQTNYCKFTWYLRRLSILIKLKTFHCTYSIVRLVPSLFTFIQPFRYHLFYSITGHCRCTKPGVLDKTRGVDKTKAFVKNQRLFKYQRFKKKPQALVQTKAFVQNQRLIKNQRFQTKPEGLDKTRGFRQNHRV